MDFTKVRVLLTDGGARQTMTILHGLKEIGCHVTVLCSSKYDVCYVSKLPDERVVDACAAGSHEGFVPFLMEQLKTGKYDVILPVAEMTTNKVTLNEEQIRQYARLACAPRSAYIMAFDKQNTFENAMKIDMPAPKTRMRDQSVEEYLQTVEFPLIIKPRMGMGSIGFHKFEKREDFWPYIQEKNIDLDEYVLQECVDYDLRLGAVFFVDQKQNVCMAYADEILRWYPIDAGTACLIRSIDDPAMIASSSELLKVLKWQGVAAISYMVDKHTGEPKLLEINGRIPASIRLSHQLGYNVAKLLIEMAFDEEVQIYPANTTFGQMTRHFQADLAWFVKSPDRFRANPSWFNWKDTQDVVLWKGDLKPWFAYTFKKVLTFREIMSKRQH